MRTVTRNNPVTRRGLPGPAVVIAGLAATAHGGLGDQLLKLQGDDTAPGDQFGNIVAISGSTAVVGARGGNSAYLFDTTTGVQRLKLSPSDGESSDFFGDAVAISGTTAIVGARFHDGFRGAAYIFDTVSGQQLHKLNDPQPAEEGVFGISVAINGTVAIVGRLEADDACRSDLGTANLFDVSTGQTESGAAYVFDLQTGAQLAPDDGASGDRFGLSVGIGGGKLIVGAPFNATQGAAYLFDGDVDTDGDGLLDSWETLGIPYVDQNGDEQRYVLQGADPDHKDLYVEIDTMAGVPFPADAKERVELAFDAAPLENPDGFEGIKLHILVDEEDLPFEEETFSEEVDFPPGAGITRFNRFGTKAEREEGDRFFRLAAKAQAYRYCLVFNDSNHAIGGLAEVGGDDMIIYVGGYSDLDKAAVFMHELGHCLGLRHGGGEGIADEGARKINGKPNYPSIMNYVLAYKEPWNASFWKLDYSRKKLATLEENDLSELASVGTGGDGRYDNFFMPFHGIVPVGAECYDEELWGESLISYADLDPSVLTDLNLDCDTDDEQFDADLNFVPGSGLPGSVQPSPGETLEGHDDWSNLLLPVDDGGGLFAGRVPTDELTDDQREYMRENFPPPPAPECLADLDGNGIVDFDDLLAVLAAWGEFAAPEDLDGNGYVDFGDLLIVLAAWGACT